MTSHTTSKDSSGALALDRCDDLVVWYERNKNRQRLLDNVLQASETWPEWAIVVPAVITTVATWLSANFRFRMMSSPRQSQRKGRT